MNKKYLTISLIILLTLSINGCSSANKNLKVSDSTYLLGTLVKVTVYGKDVTESQFNETFDVINRIEDKVSKNIPTSEVSMINNNAGLKASNISDATLEIINKSIYYSELSNGKFDITVGPLVDLWGIGTENARIPTDDEIDRTIQLVDYKDIGIDNENKSVGLNSENMQIDLGGIAKGYVADEVANHLKDNGIKHAIINLGGNILTIGEKPNGDKWKIGVQNPYDVRGKELGIVSVKDKSVVTSGIYERFFEEDGIRYHHILDPFTGYPINNKLASVTILSDYSIDGDALSTVIFSAGLEEGYKLIEELENIEAVFVTKDYEVYMTSGASKVFNLTNKEFTIKKLD